MSTTREQIISTMARLLERQGYFATGLNQIVAESGAPRGSLYYYFPAGKEEITAEAIVSTSREVEERMRSYLAGAGHAAEAIPGFVRVVAGHVAAADCRSGGWITTVALETSAVSERLRTVCEAAYGAWAAALRDKLLESGYGAERAERLATFTIACLEGGIVLSRTRRSADPLLQIADELAQALNAGRP